jgi:hypothetical protein
VKHFLLTLLLVYNGAGCATKALISSSPPGVSLFDGEKKLGDTPLEVSSDTLTPSGDTGGFMVRLEKEGYHKVWLWIPKGVRGLNMSVNLQPFLMNDQKLIKPTSKAKLDAISANLLSVQQELLLGQEVSEDRVATLVKNNPEIGTSYFLEAVLLLRKGDKGEAFERLGTAMRLSPNEPDYIALYRELGGDPLKDSGEATKDAPSAAAKNAVGAVASEEEQK